MKKFLQFILFAVLIGGVCHVMLPGLMYQRPLLVSHIQEINLKKFEETTPDAKIFYNGEQQIGAAKVYRSLLDAKLIIKKEGFKDYQVNLYGVWSPVGAQNVFNTKDDMFSLLKPVNTLTSIIFAPWRIPVAIFGDVFNIAAFPFVALWNPWQKYKSKDMTEEFTYFQGSSKFMDTLRYIVLEPTDELKESCHKNGYFVSNLGCTDCSYKWKVLSSKEESNFCADRFWNDSFSFSCEDPDSNEASEEESSRCKNRERVGHRSVFKCPEEKPLVDSKLNVCFSCDTEQIVDTSEDVCNKCPGRQTIKGKCLKCSVDKPLAGWAFTVTGKYVAGCYSCDSKEEIVTSKEICDKCPNRESIKVNFKGDKCFLKCSDDKPLLNHRGYCLECDTKTVVSTTEEICNRCSNRDFEDGKCFLKCPADLPLHGYDEWNHTSSCHSCEEEKRIRTTQEGCKKCSNRRYNNFFRFCDPVKDGF